jgi:type VI secretion system protein ImpC
LTIKYRTSIDGQLVPQKLPFRLLVLADLTGRKDTVDPTGGKVAAELVADPERAIEKRSVVSLSKGTIFKEVMRDRKITIPIPFEKDDPDHKALRDHAAVPGVFDGDLQGAIEEIGDDGICAVHGNPTFTAGLHDNAPVTLGSGQTLRAVGMVPFTVTVPAAATAKVTTKVAVEATGAGAVTWGVVTTTAGKTTVAMTSVADTIVIKQTVGDAELFKGQVSGPLSGTPVVDPTDPLKGTLPIGEEVTLTSGGKPSKWTLTPQTLALVRTAPDALWTVATPAGTIALSGETLRDATADVPFATLFDADVKVGQAGVTRAKFKAGNSVTLKTAAPEFQVTGSLGGDPLEGALASVTRSPMPALPAFGSVDLNTSKAKLTRSAGAPLTANVTLPVTLGLGAVTLTLSGSISGKPIRSGVNPDEIEEITADVSAPSLAMPLALITGDKSERVATVALADGKPVITVNVKGKVASHRTIAIKDMDSFSPDMLGTTVPEVRRLRILRDLLGELKTELSLRVDGRNALAAGLAKVVAKSDTEFDAIKSDLTKRYSKLVFAMTEPTPSDDIKQSESWTNYVANVESKVATSIDKAGANPANDPFRALIMDKDGGLQFLDREQGDGAVDDHGRLANALAILIINGENLQHAKAATIGTTIDDLVKLIDDKIRDHVKCLLEHPSLRDLERNWRGVQQVFAEVEDDQVIIDLLDISKEELREDLADHSSDIFTSTLFKRIYIDEYDRYGGRPFGAMLGLYDFDSTKEDIEWLTTMGEIANAAHCPFISSVNPRFFGKEMKKWSDLETIGDIQAHLNLPKFGDWNVLRERLEAPYIGLTLPGYLARKPWRKDDDQLGNRFTQYTETITDPDKDYLWGNSAILFGRNMIRSFNGSGWCQYLRGPKGGGLLRGLTIDMITRHGKEELQSPVQVEIADYRELQFANAGLIPLIHCKGTADAAFFSVRSAKKAHEFMREIDTQNDDLIANLAYTLSITRVAHYVKKMMREYIGSTADLAYIQNTLQLWLNDYITTTVNPDDLTLRYYPFKAVSVSVVPKPGPLGWYKATISILPHIQFEGMDVELRLEAALGGK